MKTVLRRLIWAGVLIGLVFPITTILLYRLLPPLVTPLMLVRDAPMRYDFVDLEQISPSLVQAVLVSEDQRFCEHSGFDWKQMGIVWDELLNTGSASRGASTISMQTAKNLFLWPTRSKIRKALEIPLTLMLETLLPKRRILELYLNIAEFGEGIYGAEAAAQAHFNRDAKGLTRGQAARLAAVLPNPLERNAGRPSHNVQSRANQISGQIRVAPAALWSCL
ncbi:monofunctional biosynthetic peptidoglycan transglycosylase [Kiloniella laminariae]|uniref:Biosynthetic peptidoglycan transglycosylase n=1 Tax=Kiloniella laminariae TaxID=454162 RepID=A0ABT4LMI1_9PROT|nr:monofunctional biosynthetic peptidoglycan transglycosylase [Kiloniella laminariae]MCZ4282302.1 monofunctional biosynthetic peptidoglycan transglycosylase [Kiloniella laminariae]